MIYLTERGLKSLSSHNLFYITDTKV